MRPDREPAPAPAGENAAPAAARHGQRLETVQILRALAASLVVLGHLQGIIGAHPQEFGPFNALPISGGAGVDLFFAISGFIIVHSGTRMLGRPHAPRDFLTRRLARIVPLYWAATAATLLLALLGRHALPPASEIAASLGFVPYAHGEGAAFYPIFDLGWTLNYEIEFYVLFALCMRFGRRYCVIATAAMLCTLMALGAILQLGGPLVFWTRPILLEFCGGMLVASLYQHSRATLPAWLRAVLVVAAVALYAADPFGLAAIDVTPNDMRRVIGWGVPGALMLVAAVWTPLEVRSAWVRVGVLLGNASFALYLLHPFAITFCRHVLAIFSVPYGYAGWTLVGIALPCAAVVSILTYLYAEKPLTAWLSDRLKAGGASGTGRTRANLAVSS